jgi:hypothetical protein
LLIDVALAMWIVTFVGMLISIAVMLQDRSQASADTS